MATASLPIWPPWPGCKKHKENKAFLKAREVSKAKGGQGGHLLCDETRERKRRENVDGQSGRPVEDGHITKSSGHLLKSAQNIRKTRLF